MQNMQLDITNVLDDKSEDTDLDVFSSIDDALICHNLGTFQESNNTALTCLYTPKITINLTENTIITVYKLNGFIQCLDSYSCCVCALSIERHALLSHYCLCHLPLEAKDSCKYCLEDNDNTCSLERHLSKHSIELIKKSKIGDNCIEMPQFIPCNKEDFYLYHICNVGDDDRVFVKKLFFKLFKTEYECMECNSTNLKKVTLEKHICNGHLQRDTYTCNKCKYLFTDKIVFYNHIKTCLKCSFLCQEIGCTPDAQLRKNKCSVQLNKQLSDVQNKKHIGVNCNEQNFWKSRCKVCHMRFKNLYLLKKHRKNKQSECRPTGENNEERMHYCTVCFSRFKTRYLLKQHRKIHKNMHGIGNVTHGEFFKQKAYTFQFDGVDGRITNPITQLSSCLFQTCSICQKQFTSRHYYERHCLNEHPDHCRSLISKRDANKDKVNNNKNTNDSHNISKNGTDNQLNKCQEKETSHSVTTDKYFCSFCERNYNKQGQFLNHMRRSHKIKGYTCDICDKMFSVLSELNKHSTAYRHDRGCVIYEGLKLVYSACNKENNNNKKDKQRYLLSRALEYCKTCFKKFYSTSAFLKHSNC